MVYTNYLWWFLGWFTIAIPLIRPLAGPYLGFVWGIYQKPTKGWLNHVKAVLSKRAKLPNDFLEGDSSVVGTVSSQRLRRGVCWFIDVSLRGFCRNHNLQPTCLKGNLCGSSHPIERCLPWDVGGSLKIKKCLDIYELTAISIPMRITEFIFIWAMCGWSTYVSYKQLSYRCIHLILEDSWPSQTFIGQNTMKSTQDKLKTAPNTMRLWEPP